MEHALHLPNPSRAIVIPLVAAALGAGAATATYAVVDSGQAPQAKVVMAKPTGTAAKAQPEPMSGHRP